MRELKFRQWIAKYKRFHYFEYKDGHLVGPAEASIYENPIMQYIGIKDKNGKEIYESDIISIDNSSNFEIVTYKEIFEVHYGHGESDFTYGMGFSVSDYGNKKPILEIIGNIYENQDLDKIKRRNELCQ